MSSEKESPNSSDFKIEAAWQDLEENRKASYVLSSGHLADCSFVVGSDPKCTETFPCHKLLLAFCSPVFEAMFYGGFKEAVAPTEIRLTDFKPTVFRMFLEYIYIKDTKKLETLQVDELIQLAGISKMYLVGDLENSCISVIKERVLSFNQCNGLGRVLSFDQCNGLESVKQDPFTFRFGLTPQLTKKMDVLNIYEIVDIFEYAKRTDNTEILNAIIKALKHKAAALNICSRVYELEVEFFKCILELLVGAVTEETRFQLVENYIKTNGLAKNKPTYIDKASQTFETNYIVIGKNNFIKSDDLPAGIQSNSNGSQMILDEENLMKLINYNKMTAVGFCNGPGNSDLLKIEDKYEILKTIILNPQGQVGQLSTDFQWFGNVNSKSTSTESRPVSFGSRRLINPRK